MTKILGIDYGQKRVGISITDDAQSQVFMRETIEVKSVAQLVKDIGVLCQADNVSKIVIGWPVPLAGGDAVPQALTEFATKLADQTGLPVIRFDERLTSDQADRWIHEMPGISIAKGRRDQLSAMIILQNFLDTQSK